MNENPVLYWNIVSPFSRAVKCLTDIGGVSCKLISVDLFKLEQNGPKFASLNPMKQVPVLVHNGFTLTESSAILVYLWETYESIPRSYYGSTPQQKAAVNQYLSWCQSYFAPAIGQYFTLMKNSKLRKNKQISAEQLSSAKLKSEDGLKTLNNLIGANGNYLVNSTATIADLEVYFILTTLIYYGKNHFEYENVDRWFKSIYQIKQVKVLTHQWFPIAKQIWKLIEQSDQKPSL